MHVRAWLLPLTLLTLGFAGCIGIDETGTGDGADAIDTQSTILDDVRAMLADVPCEVDTVTPGEMSGNLLAFGSLSLPEGMHGELDILDDLAIVASYSVGGLEVVDVSDPRAPVLLATYLNENDGTSYDAKWFPDGTGAVIGHGRSVEIVDMRDPLMPVQESSWDFPGTGMSQNAHMLYVSVIADATYVFISPNADRGVDILRVDGEAGMRTLTFLGSWAPFTVAGRPVLGGGPLGPHDMWVTYDEVLEGHVMYVANGFEGWVAADVSDPEAPMLLGVSPNQDAHQGYTHTIQAAHVGDKRLVVTISEVGANGLKVYDATNLMAPVLVASWVNDAVKSSHPQHNLQIVGDYLFVAHYTYGVFVFDMTDIPTMPLAGAYQMSPMAGTGGTGSPVTSPIPFSDVWDVVVADGLVYINDIEDGLTTVGFGCFVPGDEVLTSTG